MGWAFVIFTAILLCVGVACTVFWFRQARVKREASEGERKGL